MQAKKAATNVAQKSALMLQKVSRENLRHYAGQRSQRRRKIRRRQGQSRVFTRVYVHIVQCEQQLLMETGVRKHKRLPIRTVMGGIQGWFDMSDQVKEAYAACWNTLRSTKEVTGHSPAYYVEVFLELKQALCEASCFQDIWRAFASVIRAISGESVFVVLTMGDGTLSKVVEFIKERITELIELLGEFGLQGTSSNPFSFLRNLVSNFELYCDHPVIEKLRRILWYVLSFSFLKVVGIDFDTLFYTRAEAEFIQNRHSSVQGFVYSLFDGLSYIMERLYDCYETKSWAPLKHSSAAFGAWTDEVYALKSYANLLANPEAVGITYHEFLGRLDTAIATGTALVKYLRSDDKKSSTLCKRLLAELEFIRATELTKRAAREQRNAPFSLLLFAGSSVGKSTIQHLLFTHLGKLSNLPISDDHSYTRVYTDDFWSGFQSHMWCIFMDDIAAKNPNLGEDLSMRDVLQIVNNVPFTPPQAELADKGRTPLKARLVVASTNTKDLNAYAYYCNALAIQRRFPYVVTVTVKPKYSIQDPQTPLSPAERMNLFLDSSKADEKPGEYPDYWDFVIEKVKPETDANMRQSAKMERVFETSDIYEFMAYVSELYFTHEKNQAKVAAARQAYAGIEICKLCTRPKTVQVAFCNHIQSSEIVLATCATTCMIALFYIAVRQLMWDAKREFSPRRFLFGAQLDALDEIRQSVRQIATSASERSVLECARVKEQIGKAVQIVRDNKWKSLAIGSLFLAIPACLAAARLYRQLQLQGTESLGGRISAKDEKENVWTTNEYVPSQMEYGRLTMSWNALDFTKVEEIVSRNVMYAELTYERLNGSTVETVMKVMRLTALGGQMYVTNAHNIPVDQGVLRVVPRPQSEGMGETFTVTLTNIRKFRVPDRDLIFLEMRNVPARFSVAKLLASESFRTQCDGVMLARGASGCLDRVAFQNARKIVTPTEIGVHVGYEVVPSRPTLAGECGSPYLLQSPVGPVLAGIHMIGGSTKSAFCQIVTKEDYARALEALKTVEIVPSDIDLRDANGVVQELTKLHHKSTFNYIEHGVASVYGRLPGVRVGGKSKVSPTPLCSELVAEGWKETVGAPVMRGYEPWRLAHLPIVQQEFVADQSVIDKCVEAFAADILAGLSSKDLAELIVLDNESTVNGLPGVKFIDKMKRNTSAGFPWRCRKDKHMDFLGQHDIWEDYAELTPEIMERVEEMHDKLRNGERAMPIYIEHLKDEPRSLKKIAEKNTRVFSGCPVTFGFLMRKYLLTTVRVIQNNRYLFECAPGTNATSLEWDEMYHYLTKFGVDRLIAGDFRHFDKKMGAQWILAAFDVILRILEAAGWHTGSQTVVRTMAHDVAFPVMDANGDLVMYWGSNPSGIPITVILNSFVNALYMRYAWYMSGHDLSTFKVHIALMTYGDDNAIGVSSHTTGFDHTVIVREMAKIGVGYTMADKGAASVPFINMTDITFLKRRWIYMPEVGSHVAQLERESIQKSLMFHIPSKSICVPAQMVAAMGTALREMFFYGREEYDQFKLLMQRLIRQQRWEAYAPESWMTFDGMVAAYLEDNKCFTVSGRCDVCVSCH